MGVPADHLLDRLPDPFARRDRCARALFRRAAQADAIVTDRPGVAVGASSADCGPVLFADPKRASSAPRHAGWKGAFTGVLENTIATMESLGARRENIVAVLGPSISAANYEVGPEFVERFVAADPANDRYFAPSASPAMRMFDLNRYTVDRLLPRA